MLDPERLQRVRTKLVEEMAVMTKLEGTFKQGTLKERTQRIKSQIGEIETMFLTEKNVTRYRTVYAEELFLTQLERLVDELVTRPRLDLESVLKKFGPDATFIER